MNKPATPMFTIDGDQMLVGSDGTYRPASNAECYFLRLLAEQALALRGEPVAAKAGDLLFGGTPTPWNVFYENGIIEIQSGKSVVIQWSGFDNCDLPMAEHLANAHRIVACVNAAPISGEPAAKYERAFTDAKLNRLTETLVAIYNFLPPPPIQNGEKWYRFEYPESMSPNDILHKLAERIRAIPESLDAAPISGEPVAFKPERRKLPQKGIFIRATSEYLGTKVIDQRAPFYAPAVSGERVREAQGEREIVLAGMLSQALDRMNPNTDPWHPNKSEAFVKAANALLAEYALPLTAIKGEEFDPRDWPEDFQAEPQAMYSCRCAGCGKLFHGHKHRVLCKACAAIKGEPK